MLNTFHRVTLLYFFGLGSLLLTLACSPAAQPPPEAGQPAAGAQIKRGGTLTLPLNADPPHLDAHQSQSFATAAWAGLAQSRLLGWKAGPDVSPTDIVLEGDLAERWEIAPDAATVTFHLRKGVKWHNLPPVNGRELTAEDVKFTMERAKDCKVSFYCSFVEPVAKIETPDNSTVKVTLKEPVVAFPYFMSSVNFPIVPKELAEQEDGLKRRVIGTGPFVFEKWERAAQVVIKRNPEYYNKDLPYLDEIVYAIMPDVATRQAAFLSKQVDYYSVGDKKELTSVTDRVRDALVQEVLGRGCSHYLMRADKPPLNDIRVRQALNLAFDRQDYIKTVQSGEGKLCSPVPAGYGRWSIPQDELLKLPLYQYDLNKAKALLAEAGYPNGFAISMDHTPAHGQAAVDRSSYFAQAWRKIGVEVKLNSVEYARFLLNLQTGDSEFIQGGGQISFTDPEELLLWLQGAFKALAHDPKWDTKLDDYIKRQRSLANESERIKLMHELQRHLIEQGHYIVAATGVTYNVTHRYVKDFYPHSYGVVGWGSARLTKVWLDK